MSYGKIIEEILKNPDKLEYQIDPNSTDPLDKGLLKVVEKIRKEIGFNK